MTDFTSDLAQALDQLHYAVREEKCTAVSLSKAQAEALHNYVRSLEFKESRQQPWTPTPVPTPRPYPWKNGTTCAKCGMFFEYGKAYGYACVQYPCAMQVNISYATSTMGDTNG